MERLLAAYEYTAEACGVWGILLLAFTVTAFFIQFRYWALVYGRIPTYRNPVKEDTHQAVSVAVVLHEPDYGFIETQLSSLLSQEYGAFEVIVADLTGDVEFSEALGIIAENNPKFVVTRMARDPRFPISDKMAFNVAIKASRYENILLTTPDSLPYSPLWIARMARGFDGAEVVIGYCGMDGGRSFTDRMIRLGCVGQSARWLSAGMRGKPYRGTIQNLGFRKQLYFDSGGFSHLNMNIGEDDLFIQKLLKSARASVIVSTNSLVHRKIWGGMRWWYSERRMHSNAFGYYPARVKRYIAAELWSRSLFFAAAAACAVALPLEFKLFSLALLLIRLGIVMLEMYRISRRLSEKGIMRAVPLYDLCSPLYEAWMALDRRFRRSPGLWR